MDDARYAVALLTVIAYPPVARGRRRGGFSMKLCLAFTVDMMWEIRRWLANHPRFHLHFTPTYGSWLNLVERWFATLTTKQLRRGTHRSVAALKRAISSVHRDHQRASDTVRVDQECR